MTFISLSIVALLFTLSNAAEYPETSFEETIDVITSLEPVPFIYSFNITSGVDTGSNSTLNLTILFIGDECVNPSMSLDYLMVDYNGDNNSDEYLVIKGADLTQKCGGNDNKSRCLTFAPCISDYQLPAIDGPLEFSILKSGEVNAICASESISVRLWITISCDPKFAINDATSTDQFTSQTIDLFANDLLADSFEFVSLGSPETGFVINYGNGTITYVPGPEAQERCEDIAEDSFNVTFDYEVAIENTPYYDIGVVIIEVSCIDIAVEPASDFASDSDSASNSYESSSDSRVYKKKKVKKRKYEWSDESSDEIFKAVNVAEEANVFGGNPQTATNKEVISVRIAADNVWVQFGLMIAVFFVGLCCGAVIVLNNNNTNKA